MRDLRFSGIVLAFFLSPLFFACNKDSQEIPLIRQSDFKEKEADLHKLVKEELYIPLDNSVPLQFVSKIVGAGDKLLVEDQDILYLYSREGKFIRQIGSKGNGPEEYLMIGDYCVDDKEGKIYLLSPKNKLMVFNLEGEFIESFVPDEEISFNRIVFRDNVLYLFDTFSWGSLEYNWIIIDLDGKRLKEKYNYIPDYNSQMNVGYDPVFENENLIYYWNNLNDTIYELDGMASKAAFLLAREEGRINTEDLKDIMSYSQLEKWQPYSIRASGDYLIFGYNIFGEKLCHASVWYDTKANSPISVNIVERSTKNVGIDNLLEGNINFYARNKIMLEGKEYLVGWEPALDFKQKAMDYLSDNGDSDPDYINSEQYKVAEKLNVEDNPVIILVSLK
jgi:hypothetical protein